MSSKNGMPALVEFLTGGERVELTCPRSMPHASAFLWNRKLLLQINCRGYAVAQHMQPEPAKYSHAPVLEQRTFMQPEQPLYAHHPGRFVYVSDAETGDLFSVPHEPVRRAADEFVFSAGTADIEWRVRSLDIETRLSVSLPTDEALELWTFELRNTDTQPRRINVFPCFSIGYMSWMNQSARYRDDLGAIVATCVTPYQKVADYPRIAALKDKTVLLHDIQPDAWETCRDTFEGEGGIHNPDAVNAGQLKNGDAIYETPIAALQYQLELQPGESRRFRFLFGPARDDAEITSLRARYFQNDGFESAQEDYSAYIASGPGCLRITTPDKDLDNFVNHWLGRQVYYHGDTNRLTTDPQTRNFLQDTMGMVYVRPEAVRDALLLAIGQQKNDGRMPEGVLLDKTSELKYINQVPHTDHCVWLPVALESYLNETGDFSILEEDVAGVEDGTNRTVLDRVTSAMRWLIGNSDERGLSLIDQGDWCDPMNMVGHGGKGVSGWLTIATAHALRLWADVCRQHGQDDIADEMTAAVGDVASAVQEHLWDGDWFARGISDDGTSFGVHSDTEGKIYLNPQSWALMSGIATEEQKARIIAAVQTHLDTPYGACMLAPPYTSMQEHIGRVTQKHPGSAENGSTYNHAAAFWIHALFASGEADGAYAALRKMIPGPGEDDYLQRGQLPVFVPNYYRGAMQLHPRTAGRSSQLFNTGAASWLYRILIEDLFGLKGCPEGLRIDPRLPSEWRVASATRVFRGAVIKATYRRDASAEEVRTIVDGQAVATSLLRKPSNGKEYDVEIILPDVES